MSRAKYWCFTVNNYTEDELNLVRGLVERREATYVVCGIETGETGTPHLQGYLELATRKRLAQVKQFGGLSRAHLERRRGTQEEAKNYCEKDGNSFEFGTLTETKAGQRTDLQKACDAIKDGANARDLWHDHTEVMVKYGKGLKEAIGIHSVPKKKKTFPLEEYAWHPLELEDGYSHILWGESGIGKTSYIRSRFPTYLWVTHMDDLGKFEGEVHEGIVFDDMSFTHLPRSGQIHLVDQDDDRSIHIRYQTALIPAGTPKIFSANSPYIFDIEDAAIKRRVKVHEVIGVAK